MHRTEGFRGENVFQRTIRFGMRKFKKCYKFAIDLVISKKCCKTLICICEDFFIWKLFEEHKNRKTFKNDPKILFRVVCIVGQYVLEKFSKNLSNIYEQVCELNK